ncbi:MAG: ATP-dependent DNA helicase RecG [Actinobacteria bacterium]|nr:ATP-dependent DNA helicase RecG [Actinomycetota bacterium]
MTEKRAESTAARAPGKLPELWSTAEKILAQELRSGCADRTVFGGLSRFLSRWSTGVSGEGAWAAGKAAQFLGVLSGYENLTPDERAVAVRSALVIARGAAVDGQRRTEADAGGREGPVVPHKTGGKPKPAAMVRGAAPSVPRPAARSTQQPARSQYLSLDDPVFALRGVGKLRASRLAKLGIEKLRDLLLHFPRDYRDYRAIKRVVDLMYGETASVVGVVEDVQVVPGPRRRFRTTVKVRDESGRVSATWFRYGYGGVKVTPGTRVALAGTVAGYAGQLIFESPDWEDASAPPLHTRRLVPVYPLTEGVSDYWLRSLMAEVVPSYAPRLPETLPAWVRSEYGLMGLPEAVALLHFPDTPERLHEARRRLAFEELFLVQVSALRRRAEWQSGSLAPPLKVEESILKGFLERQPFELTQAQRRVTAEILADLGRTRPMTRLLQGDVGSGKTIVAAVALLAAVAGGCQGALMAPTEILAEQHARTLGRAFSGAGDFLKSASGRELRLEVLTSASRPSQRDAIYEGAAAGEVDILIGTQALIQEGLGFRRLGLAIIDEQHRFGVVQRATLREKGGSPHLLVMTATPIPRTLALTLYGDLDLSIIDEMPPGRQQVKTVLLGPSERKHAYEHIRREVAKGRQAFIICPLVEDSPHLEVRAATAEYERLRHGELAGLRLALLHGRMRPSEKDRIMLDFRNGEYDVLVSTSVVEVGIDVPNAAVVVVEGADRFGMAQLHQFRGRVGRGEYESYCVLLSDSQEEAALERLRVVAAVSDGFRLADEDLRLRGPGDYLGVRQSGLPELRVADLRDVRLIETAREAATKLLVRDPELAAEEHRALAARIEEFKGIASG